MRMRRNSVNSASGLKTVVFTLIFVVFGSSSCQPPSMKLIGPPGTELRHTLAVHIMCPCDLDI